jgi:hypothetical protein
MGLDLYNKQKSKTTPKRRLRTFLGDGLTLQGGEIMQDTRYRKPKSLRENGLRIQGTGLALGVNAVCVVLEMTNFYFHRHLYN